MKTLKCVKCIIRIMGMRGRFTLNLLLKKRKKKCDVVRSEFLTFRFWLERINKVNSFSSYKMSIYREKYFSDMMMCHATHTLVFTPFQIGMNMMEASITVNKVNQIDEQPTNWNDWKGTRKNEAMNKYFSAELQVIIVYNGKHKHLTRKLFPMKMRMRTQTLQFDRIDDFLNRLMWRSWKV